MLPRRSPSSRQAPIPSFLTLTCRGFALALTLTLTLTLPTAASPHVDALHALFQSEWNRTLAENPTYASQLGDRRYHAEWKDLDLNAFERSHTRDQQALNTLLALPRDLLPPAEQRNYDLFRIDLQDRLDAFPHRWWLIALDQRQGLQTQDDLANSLPFDTVEDYQAWIQRLRHLGRHTDQTIDLLREGIRQGRVQARVTMERVPSQIARHIVDAPKDSPFYLPLRRFPTHISPNDRDRLRAEAKTAIAEVVIPAYTRFLHFFTSEYLPACRTEPGIHALPGGDALYALFARQFTTTSLTPQDIHDLGLREVDRIRNLMEQTRQEAGFSGSLEEYFHHLRTDPQYFHSSPLELLAAYQVVSKRIDPTLVRLFRTFPRTPYGVEPIPPAIAPDTTTAYYRPPAADGSRAGTYFVNLFRPETRPKWEMMALSLHEAVPGHHFQIALAQEQGSLPEFRRHAYYTAYLEGWALYAEALGYELGLYTTPEERMGQLTYEMWRAVRLVVDTGIHAFGWDRDRAISYFRHHAPKAELDIVNEIDRYIAWPGQALAYKIGELKIKELRARAESALGPRFDLRDFHDVVLLPGARPLSLLESDVQQWIHDQSPASSLTLTQSVSTAQSLPWPEWRGPHAQGHSSATSLPLEWSESKNIRWKSPIPGRGHSSPVIGNDLLWVTTAHETPATPEDTARRLASNTGDQPVQVLAEARFHAVGLDLASGRIVHDIELFKVRDPQWVHAQNSYASPSPVLAGHHLYAHFGSFGTAALDTRTGQVDWVWQEIQVMHENGPGSSPVIWNDLLLFHLDGSDSQQIVALHRSTGQLAWSTPRTGKMGDHPQVRKAYGTPLILTFENQPEALSVAADWLYSYDPATGRELWKLPYGGLGFSNVPRPVYGHGFLYILTGFMRPEVLAVRYDGTAPATIAWRYNRGVSLTPSPILVGDELYFISDAGGLLTCLNAHTGERHYQERLGGNFAASPTYADGRLYFHDRDGVTTVIQPGPTFQVLARNTLDAPIQSTAAINGQALYLRTQQAVYRIETQP